MSRIYTMQQKRHAMYVLEQLEDFQATSQQLNIPERTLRDWWQQRRKGELGREKYPAAAYEGKLGSITTTEIRDRLLETIEKLTRALTDDPRKAYYGSLAIQRILEQVKNLNEIMDVPVPPDNSDESSGL